MFDRIGSATDPEAPRRNAASLGITAAMGTVAIGFWTAWAAFVFAPPAPLAPDEPMPPIVEIALKDPALPKVPEPPAAAPAAAKGEPAPPVPTTEPAEPQTLDDHVRDEIVSKSGAPDGAPGGTGTNPDGDGPGAGLGPATGTGDGVPTIASAALRWRSKPAPSWPSAATAMGITEAECTALVEFDARGVPTMVTFAECPGVFQRGARSAILRSRVEPFETGGHTVSVRTTIRFRYLLEE